ncbi:cytochrome P450 [Streptomyces colonosanans]|uniref:Cytochrome n=1 Tax=Streptomyces colonosanans TaxID=1428652 RepID=A0A1S2PK75_9ACTN|nr:cytochrome P450 [Streptomyces colonosanans]OIJ94113.1 cytochrome [Streptomyces colonosanans]
MTTTVGDPLADPRTGPGEITTAMLSAEFRRDPYPLYDRMRREAPVHRSPQGIWYLTRYADVEQALGDLRLSNDRDRMTRAFGARDGSLRDISRLTARLGRVMSNTDPPEHARLRKLVNKAFTVRRVEALRDRIQAAVDQLVDRALAAGHAMDVIAALASPLPHSVVCELFGIPDGDRERVKGWFRVLGRMTEDIDKAVEVVDQFEEYLMWLVARRRKAPGDDLISGLVATQARDDHLTDTELLSTCFMLITAGDETTTNLIGNGTLALLCNPGQLAGLRTDPTLIRAAVDELVRYDSPTQAIVRVVAEEVEFAGQTLDAGDLVYLVLAAANRDPERFEAPDRLDLTRSGNRHLGFGNGPHFCLGAPLARLETELAIGTLVRRLPELRLDTNQLEWRPNPLQRRLVALPVAY